MRRAFIACSALLLLACFVATGVAQENSTTFPFTGEVTGSRVNLRMSPDTTSAIVATMKQGSRLVVVGEKDGWYETLPTGNATVWVHKNILNELGDGTGTVLVDGAKMRSDSRITAETLGTLEAGTTVTIKGKNAEWFKIQAPKTIHCWISAKYIDFVEVYDEAELQRRAEREARAKEIKGEIDTRIAEAQKLEAIEDAKPELTQRNYSEVISLLEWVIAESGDALPTTEVESRLQRLNRLQAAIDRVNDAHANLENKMADLEEREQAMVEAQKKAYDEEQQKLKEATFDETGWVYTVGAFFGRPGSHCLKVGGKLVAFLRVPEDSDIDLNKYYEKLVGVALESDHR
jgi:SH3-like domain-containing protein